MAEAGHHVRILAGRGEETDREFPSLAFRLLISRHPEVLGS